MRPPPSHLGGFSLSFYVLEGPAKILAKIFGNAVGLGSQPLRWRGSITQTDREVLSAYTKGEAERPPPNHPYLNDWRGTEREKSPPNLAYLNDRRGERPYLNYRRRQRERQPPSHLHLNNTRREGERPPPSHLYLNDRRRQRERSPPSRWVVSLCLLLSLR